MLKRLKVRSAKRGVSESVWVLGFCSSRPQHIVREWLAAHNLWPRLVVATQTRIPPRVFLSKSAQFYENKRVVISQSAKKSKRVRINLKRMDLRELHSLND